MHLMYLIPAAKVVHVIVVRMDVSEAIGTDLDLDVNLLNSLINRVTCKSTSDVSGEFI